jgi:hypothetical protein
MKTKLLFLFLTASVAPKVAAEAPTEDAVWLAKAMVAEADFKQEKDHAALGYVLLRKHKIVKRHNPDATLTDMIRAYCSGFKRQYRGFYRRSPRLEWIYNLDAEGNEPNKWPRKLPWEKYRPMWLTVLQRAQSVIDGDIKDPCRGRASYWGGPMDNPSSRLRRVDCGKTANYFYSVRRAT